MRAFNYIYFNGNCQEALDFYQQVFAGKASEVNFYEKNPKEVHEEHKGKIMHAKLSFDEVSLMMSDAMPGQKVTAGDNIYMSLDFDSEKQLEETFEKISQDGQVTHPLQNMFWGAKFGTIKDKFAVNWMFNFNQEAHQFIQKLSNEQPHNKAL
jgi:PhnB protein